MFKVSYIHGQGYRVSRSFNTREAAQEFIDVNAMVYPLPGVRLLEVNASYDYEVSQREYSWGTLVNLYRHGRLAMSVDVYNDGEYFITQS